MTCTANSVRRRMKLPTTTTTLAIYTCVAPFYWPSVTMILKMSIIRQDASDTVYLTSFWLTTIAPCICRLTKPLSPLFLVFPFVSSCGGCQSQTKLDTGHESICPHQTLGKGNGQKCATALPPRIIPARWSNDFIRKILQINLMAASSNVPFCRTHLTFSEK